MMSQISTQTGMQKENTHNITYTFSKNSPAQSKSSVTSTVPPKVPNTSLSAPRSKYLIWNSNMGDTIEKYHVNCATSELWQLCMLNKQGSPLLWLQHKLDPTQKVVHTASSWKDSWAAFCSSSNASKNASMLNISLSLASPSVTTERCTWRYHPNLFCNLRMNSMYSHIKYNQKIWCCVQFLAGQKSTGSKTVHLFHDRPYPVSYGYSLAVSSQKKCILGTSQYDSSKCRLMVNDTVVYNLNTKVRGHCRKIHSRATVIVSPWKRNRILLQRHYLWNNFLKRKLFLALCSHGYIVCPWPSSMPHKTQSFWARLNFNEFALISCLGISTGTHAELTV